MNITGQQLRTLLPTTPQSILDKVASGITTTGDKFHMNSINRLAGFVAQCAHESCNFRLTVENLNYSSHGLRAIFPKYFPTDMIANAYARKPQAIANRVYASRMGNGDEASGDGFRYRGRGFIQITGKNNYLLFSSYVQKMLPTTVDFCETIEGALLSANWYWETHNINATCDVNDIVTMTKKINGGVNGLEKRKDLYERAKVIFAG